MLASRRIQGFAEKLLRVCARVFRRRTRNFNQIGGLFGRQAKHDRVMVFFGVRPCAGLAPIIQRTPPAGRALDVVAGHAEELKVTPLVAPAVYDGSPMIEQPRFAFDHIFEAYFLSALVA